MYQVRCSHNTATLTPTHNLCICLYTFVYKYICVGVDHDGMTHFKNVKYIIYMNVSKSVTRKYLLVTATMSLKRSMSIASCLCVPCTSVV